MTQVKKRIAITLISAIVIVVCVGYGLRNISMPSVIPSDNSILTKQPCAMPCWYGLIPGESTLETVRERLSDIPFLSGADLADERTLNDIFYVARGYQATAFSGVRFSFKNDTLSSICVSPNILYTLQNILDIYGTPAGVTMNYSTGSPEMLGAFVDINLYYPSSGLVMTFDVYRGELGKSKYQILPDAQGKQFYILPTSQTLEQLVAYFLNEPIESARASIWSQFVTEWPGLYSTIIDPQFAAYDKPPVTPNIQPQHAISTP